MQRLYKRSKVLIACLALIFLSVNVTVLNAAQTDNTECSSILASLEEKGTDTTDMTCAEAELEYNYANTDTKSFSKNVASGFLSTDPTVRTKEKNEYYYKYFLEADLVPFASQIDDSFFGVDSFINIVCTVITLFTNLVGLLNFITTTIIMFLLSLWQNGIITSLVDQLLVFINENLLGIDSITGSGMILVASLSLLIFTRNCFIYFKTGRPAKEIVKLFFVLIILIGLIPASYTQIRPMLMNATNNISDKIDSTVFGQDGSETEIELKNQVFDAMSFDGFMYKNFGVVTQEDLEARDNVTSEEAKVRIEGVLSGDNDVMKKEWKTYDSKFLSIDFSSSLSQLLTAIIWTTHSIINMILLAIPLLLLIILENVEQITWFFIWVPIVMMVFKMEEGYIASFLANRFQFLVGFTICNFVLVTLLRAELMMTELIMGYNLGFLLVLDIISLIGFYLLWSIRDSILAILRDLFKKVPAIAWGRTSTGEITSEFKPKLVELGKMMGEKLTLKKLKVDETEMPQDNPSESEFEEDHDVDNTDGDVEADIDNDDELGEGEDVDEVDSDNELELDGENPFNTEHEDNINEEFNDFDDTYDFDDDHEIEESDEIEEIAEDVDLDEVSKFDEEEVNDTEDSNNLNSILDTYFAKEDLEGGEETDEE